MKPTDEAGFSSLIEGDRTWRIREISDIKAAVRKADVIARKSLLRAFVALSYAHWEGSVRFSAEKYLEYVARRRLTYKNLDDQFLRNSFLKRLGHAKIGGISFFERCKIVDEIVTSGNKRYTKPDLELVSTRSNLNSEVLGEICLVCGISDEPFRPDFTFIDNLLLKRRNEIAHGEASFVEVEDMDDIGERTISLIRCFGNAIENRIYTAAFRAKAEL